MQFGKLAMGILTGAMLSASLSIAVAQQPEDNNPDPVFVFNRICYAQVPDVQAIKDMALKLAWRSIEPEQLEAFKSYDNPTSLAGWDAQVGERLFRVGITQGDVTEGMIKSFPDFAEGKATSCSIVLHHQQERADFLPKMQILAGKEPVSKDVPEGLLLTTTWAGGNADLKVFLFAKAPPTGKGGLLNVTILQK